MAATLLAEYRWLAIIGVERQTIIELARRAAGLTQAELAARAGTTQSTVSMYERRRKVPLLDVAERLMQAAGADLGMVTTVLWEVDFLPGLKAFWYPDRLWRVEVPGCFDRVRMPDLVRPQRARRVGSAESD
jgi:transcriptional regulator with XRE-family HTH domain